MLAFTVGSIVPTTRKDIGLRSHRILSSVLASLHTLYIYMRAPQTELIFSVGGIHSALFVRSDPPGPYAGSSLKIDHFWLLGQVQRYGTLAIVC